MIERRHFMRLMAVGAAGGALAPVMSLADRVSDIRAFGAAGDGVTIDSPAINRAIAAAAAAGGGVVRVPAGLYASHSIRLMSRVTLFLEYGATILAADAPGYDPAEPNGPWETYQDYGHNHWHNALIWGEKLHDIAILGPGRIFGRGLSGSLTPETAIPAAEVSGSGDKAIALKLCRNVVLRDFTIYKAGHFGILVTGVDNLLIENLAIDTNRDGIDIDACRHVRIADCRVNSPRDDGICLKSSFALGEARATENVTITGCHVTGYRLGTMLDGSRVVIPPGGTVQPIGRMKLGTESNGGFRNIKITDSTFTSCRGLAVETVDGGVLEDLTFANIVMRDIRNAPFFLRLGARLRGPKGVGPGALKRVVIKNVVCDAPANEMPAIISGIAGHPVEDIHLADIHIVQKGGGMPAAATIEPPEQERVYPEANCFGPLPALGLFVRHARNIEARNVEIESAIPDARPVCWMSDVEGASFHRFDAPQRPTESVFMLTDTRRFTLAASSPLRDIALDTVTKTKLL